MYQVYRKRCPSGKPSIVSPWHQSILAPIPEFGKMKEPFNTCPYHTILHPKPMANISRPRGEGGSFLLLFKLPGSAVVVAHHDEASQQVRCLFRYPQHVTTAHSHPQKKFHYFQMDHQRL